MKIRNEPSKKWFDSRPELRRKYKKTKYIQRQYRGISKRRLNVQVYSNICFDSDRDDRRMLRSFRKTGFRDALYWYKSCS